MSIVIRDIEVQQLAEQVAKANGVTVTEVVRQSLLSFAGTHYGEKQKTLRQRLAQLASEIDALPEAADRRRDDEVLGYNEHGIWS